jgi:hypothetical protein
VNGQVLRDVARIVGVTIEETMLPPGELARRIGLILDAEQRYFAQMPEGKMQGQVPGRPRSFANLAWHTFNVVDAWLELVVDAKPLTETAYKRNAPPGADGKAAILAYGADVERRFNDWWTTVGQYMDYDEPAEVFYGKQSLHDYLERTTWHCGQHSRQMQAILVDMLGIPVDRPLGPELWVGLPMPQKVWDDEPVR